jgi:hypothetical protein
MKNIARLAALACVVYGGVTAAQDAPKYLSKGEVDQALTGKVLLFKRPGDGAPVRWDMRKSDVFANLVGRGYSGGDAGRFTGTWATREDGAMCVKWRDNSPGVCHFYFWDGDKLKRTLEPTVEAAASATLVEFEK